MCPVSGDEIGTSEGPAEKKVWQRKWKGNDGFLLLSSYSSPTHIPPLPPPSQFQHVDLSKLTVMIPT